LIDSAEKDIPDVFIAIFGTEARRMTVAESQNASLVELTADIASAYVANNNVAASDLPGLIRAILGALSAAGRPVEEPAKPRAPAVSIKKSITAAYLICLEDGGRFKSIKRHLRTAHGLSGEAYRAKWGLPKDYPMVAPAYSAARSSLAKQMGLGHGARQRAMKKPAAAKSASRARAGKT
jgi:predicted transcriptional regulator